MYAHYTGVVEITPELGAILSGSENAKSTGFGDSCKFAAHHDPFTALMNVLPAYEKDQILNFDRYSRSLHFRDR